MSAAFPVINSMVSHAVLRGPLISPAAKRRVEGLISSAEEQGGTIHLDGRNISVEGYPQGNFVGPTIIEATTEMKCYQYVSGYRARC